MIRNLFLSAALIAAPVFTAQAKMLSAPTGQIILTVTGALENETADGAVTLDLAMLENMEPHSFTTTTIWIEGDVEFTGVPLRALLDYAGATGTRIEAIALNDYKVEIPMDQIETGAPLVAYTLNGAQISPRGKGPLWIVFPYDQDSKYRTEVVYSQSIWQLDRIVVTD